MHVFVSVAKPSSRTIGKGKTQSNVRQVVKLNYKDGEWCVPSHKQQRKTEGCNALRYAQTVAKLASYNFVFVAELRPKEPYYGSSGKNNYFPSCIVTPASTDEEQNEDRYIAYLKETFGDEGDNKTKS